MLAALIANLMARTTQTCVTSWTGYIPAGTVVFGLVPTNFHLSLRTEQEIVASIGSKSAWTVQHSIINRSSTLKLDGGEHDEANFMN